MKFAFLVVTYKKDLSDSTTLKVLDSLINRDKNDAWNLFVVMNDYNNESTLFSNFSNFNKFCILQNKDNRSLSKIYNEIIKNCNSDYLFIFDQDTVPSDTYVQEAICVAKEKLPALIVPKIISHNQIVSPGNLYFFWGKTNKKFFEISGFIKSSHVTGINSGLIVKVADIINNDLFFDERLMFYFTDTAFFINFKKKIKYLYLLDNRIDHDLSELDISESLEKRIFRFNEMTRGFKAVFSRSYYYPIVVIYIYYRYFRFLLNNFKHMKKVFKCLNL